MKYIIFILLFFCSCVNPNRFYKTYLNAQHKTITKEDKPTTLLIKPFGFSYTVILETYSNYCFVEKYKIDILKGQHIKTTVKPGKYFLIVIIDGIRYDDYVFNSFLSAWKVDLTNHIKEANRQHLLNQTKSNERDNVR